MMEESAMVDMLFGVLSIGLAFILRRVFSLFDKLQEEDKILHSRITELGAQAVSRAELHGAIDRVLNRIDKLEERLMNK
jgi:hypothetical protein